MMTSDPAMLEDSRSDPLLLHCATPRWYVQMRRAQTRTLSEAGKFKLPLLTLLGESDEVADNGATRDFHAAAGSTDKTLHTYPQARHELLREVERNAVISDIIQWMKGRAR